MTPTAGLGLFDTVLDSPVTAPYAIGWALLAVGTLACLSLEQLKATHGARPDHPTVIGRAIIGSIALGSYAFVPKAIWWACQSIAHDIYPDTQLQAFGKLLAILSTRFRDYHFSVLELGTGLRDGLVVSVGVVTWLLALLSHLQLEQVQIVIYNVLFTFGPMLIGLTAFGMPTGRIWLSGVLEISSWSITIAVIYRSISGQVESYVAVSSQDNFLTMHFIDVLQNLVFISSLMFVVPAVTGRLLGSAALSELGRANMGAAAGQWAVSSLQSLQPGGPRVAGAPAPPQDHSHNSHRPGDS